MSSYSMRTLLNPILPWESDQEESSRFKKILLIFIGISILFSIAIPLIEIKKPERQKTTIPPRLVKMILEKKKVVKPPPPPEPIKEEKKEEEKPKEKEPEKKPEKKPEEPKPVEKKTAKEVAKEHAAVFDALADLRDTDVVTDLTQNQNLSNNTGQAATATRSLITQKATQGSGGIKVATASRSSGTGKLAAQSSGTVKSEIGTAIENTQRVTQSGSLKRSSENIQLTFEKYKPQIFALYNRALRKNPGLQGQVNFRLVIQPDGRVSECRIESSELNDPALEKRLVSRIKRINFGAQNVEVWNNTYLINFFPGG